MKRDDVKVIVEKFCTDIKEEKEMLWCTVKEGDLIKLLKMLREGGLQNLVNLSSVDNIDMLEIIYHFSYGKNDAKTLNIRVFVPANMAEVDSITKVFPAANILEREAFEMMGINFRGHPNLKRAFLDEESPKTPLRKGKTQEQA
ncbi:MAG: NADH-quinone oxidoreductase subunit C [Candidatus Micrarchaeota archaeon]|nr:NADH-quinone oxidoreductase subunit C [Candidatus Micrarchaeota archaeon]